MVKPYKVALLVFLLFVVITTPVMGLGYGSTAGGYKVWGENSTEKYVHIPAIYIAISGDRYPVVAISANAFYNNRYFLAVTFDSTSCLKELGTRAFANCTRLTTIVLPNTVSVIKHIAFSGCTQLSVFRMPEEIATIGLGAFRNCSSLPSAIFTGTKLQTIEDYAFQDCSSLTTVTFSYGGLKTMGNFAFLNCSKLTEIALPYTVTTIGKYAFMGCSEMTSFKGPGSPVIGRLPEGVFADCAKLRSVTNIPYVLVVAKRALQGCAELTTIDRLDSLKTIEEGAFRGCAKLESFSLSKKLISVGDSAFMGCASLKEIAFPDKEDEILVGTNAFDGCASLESAMLPRNIPAIQPCTFRDCKSLRSITIPVSVTAKIGDSAFYGCTALDSVTSLTEAPHKFGKNAFTNISDKCVLRVPYGKKAAYLAKGWTESIFKGGIVELPAPEGIHPVRVTADGKGAWFDLEGREVLRPEKGRIYIRKGKKVLVK